VDNAVVWLNVTDVWFTTGDGHTELSEEDRHGLIPTYIATRADLLAAEQRNIAEALLRRAPRIDVLLDDGYLRRLHRAMFAKVWTWAGHYRLRETNIGIDPAQIPAAVRTLVDDTRAWVEYETYSVDELAIRFHHRLVAVHPFPNGNGRHGRVAADYLIAQLGRTRFSWGAALDVTTEELRARYRHALQRADSGAIGELMAFARS
jgi:Fic-DOC domain mobile mystery protein B